MKQPPQPLQFGEMTLEQKEEHIRQMNADPCPNCGKRGPHFVGPSLGERGFYICDRLPSEEQK